MASLSLQDITSAVAVSITVLEGTDGGYSPEDKQKAKATLMRVQPVLQGITLDTLVEGASS